MYTWLLQLYILARIRELVKKNDFRGENFSRLLPFCSASQSRGGGTCPAGPGFGWTTFRRSIFKSLTLASFASAKERTSVDHASSC